MSTTYRLDAIEARANAATEGPWGQVACLDTDGRRYNALEGADEIDICEIPRTPQGSEDAEFIAHARQDVPALVAALRAALDLHSPAQFGIKWCDGCDHAWPCLTVRAIESALDGAS